MHSSTEPVHWFFRKHQHIFSHVVRARINADSHTLLLELVRNGLGIARVGHDIASKDLSTGQLVQILPEYECVHMSGNLPALWLLYPAREMLHRTRLLANYLLKHLAPDVE
ncbi:MAG: LysR substrate-binding domain-containing protein [Candidimonas sp.]